ncbi:TPA: RNA methyltransferase [Patescibacteria group bacterium]|nr:RNA methyltransferase [Patescibacteria group bacterium]
MKIHIVLDNIRSAFNVGSIFRSCDGVGSVEKIYLCGMTTDTDNPKLHKTALGAIDMIDSQYYDKTVKALEELKDQNIPIYAVELTDNAKHFQKFDYPKEFALIFGHEKQGISKKILDICDNVIYIPMRGMKKSLNVANAASIILYEVTRNIE